MNGFTLYKNEDCVRIENDAIQFRMHVYPDGSGILYHPFQGVVVDIPTVDTVNLGGFPRPQIYDNIRHDIMHVWYWFVTRGTLSPNHQKLMSISDTPLWRCHWEEYKVETLEHYILTGEKREQLDCYDEAQAFIEWVMSALHP